MILYVNMLLFIYKKIYNIFMNWIYGINICNGIVIMKYYTNEREYYIKFPIHIGPNTIRKVYANKCYIDVTDTFISCMGLFRNFHGIPTTPIILGWNHIEIIYEDGNRKIYINDDIISI